MPRDDKYTSFFELEKTIYRLTFEKRFTYPSPLFNTWTPPDAATEKRHRLSIAQISVLESDTESDDHSSRHADDHSQEVVQRGEGVNLNNSVSDQSISKVTSAPTIVQSESTAYSRISNSSTGPLNPVPSTSIVYDRFVTKRKSTKPSDPQKCFKKWERERRGSVTECLT